MNQFAKLFQYPDIGQILVMIDQTEDPEKVGPEVRFSFTAPGLGVCAVKMNFPDTEEGWDKAEEVFSMADEESSYKVVKETYDHLKDTFQVEAANGEV